MEAVVFHGEDPSTANSFSISSQGKPRYTGGLVTGKESLCVCIEVKQPFAIENTNPSAEERVRYVESTL